MFQSLTAVSSVAAQAVAESGNLSDGAETVAILLSLVGLVGLVAWVLFPSKANASVAASRAPKTPYRAAEAGVRQGAPRSKRKLGAQVNAQRARDAEPSPSSRRRRLIVLYDVTPGQTPYEYNLGDSAGTRGVSPAGTEP
jgi:hypothetical protein